MKIVIVILSILLIASWVVIAQTSTRPPHKPPIITPDIEVLRIILIDVVGTLKDGYEGNVQWATESPATHVLTQNDGWIPEATIAGVKGWIEQQQDLVDYWMAHEQILINSGPP